MIHGEILPQKMRLRMLSNGRSKFLRHNSQCYSFEAIGVLFFTSSATRDAMRSMTCDTASISLVAACVENGEPETSDPPVWKSLYSTVTRYSGSIPCAPGLHCELGLVSTVFGVRW